MRRSFAVLGASRGVGLAVVQEALARGHSVTGFARSPPVLADPGLTWVRGDVRTGGGLAEALSRTAIVVTALGTRWLGPTRLFSDAARAVIAAMRQVGATRLVAVTGCGAGDSRGRGGFVHDRILFPLLLARLYADKDREEALIRGSGLDWTIVRPGRLTDGARTGRIRVLTDPADYRFAAISRADVAAFLVDCAEQGACRGQSPVIVGG